VERMEEKLGRDLQWTLKQGLFVRQVLGGGAERWLKTLRQGLGAEKGLRRAFGILLEFVIGGFWFVLYSSVLLIAPGYDAVSNEDPGNGEDDG
jgi:hypothetical protein